MFSAGAIESTLGLDTSPFAKGMLNATSIAQTFPGVVTSFLANPVLGLVNVFGQAFTAITGVVQGALGTIKQAFDDSFNQADKLHDLATNAGVSAQQLSGLGLVAKQSGSNVDEVAESYKFLGKNISEAMSGNKQVATDFKRFGIAFKDTSGAARPLNDVMMDVADVLNQLPEGAARTGAAMTLLNRGGAGMIATLSQGSGEIRNQIDLYTRLGAVVTDRAANSADAYGDVLGELEMAWKGMQNAIGEPLREALTPVLRAAADWIAANMPKIQAAIADAIGAVIDWTARAADVIEEHWPQIEAVIKGVWNTLSDTASIFVSTVKFTIDAALHELEAFLSTVQSMSAKIADILPDKLGGSTFSGIEVASGEAAADLREKLNAPPKGPGRFETAAHNLRDTFGGGGSGGDFGDVPRAVRGGGGGSLSALSQAANDTARSMQRLPSMMVMTGNQLGDFKAALAKAPVDATQSLQKVPTATNDVLESIARVIPKIEAASDAITELMEHSRQAAIAERERELSAARGQPAAVGTGSNTFNVQVSTPFDVNDASSQMAQKLRPSVQQLHQDFRSRLGVAASLAGIRAGL